MAEDDKERELEFELAYVRTLTTQERVELGDLSHLPAIEHLGCRRCDILQAVR